MSLSAATVQRLGISKGNQLELRSMFAVRHNLQPENSGMIEFHWDFIGCVWWWVATVCVVQTSNTITTLHKSDSYYVLLSSAGPRIQFILLTFILLYDNKSNTVIRWPLLEHFVSEWPFKGVPDNKKLQKFNFVATHTWTSFTALHQGKIFSIFVIIAPVKEGCPRNLIIMGFRGHILVNYNTKVFFTSTYHPEKESDETLHLSETNRTE